LTVDEIQERISAELKRRAVGDGSQVSVGIRQYASHSVVVTGLVVSPGTKFLRREAVPLYVILAEAQLRNDAGRVQVRRSDTTAFDLNVTDMASMNIHVVSGDIISVSGKVQEFYYIAGRVNFPGQKVYQPGITLLQAVLAAGGVQRNQNNIEISREGAGSRLVTTRFKITEIKAGRIADPKLLPGDRIEVLN
jgi:protein involved in polysaccharide export with SLBB domain